MNQPIKVLVLEDDEGVLLYVKTVLEREGMNVLTALCGHTGLELAHQTPPDLILTDFHMPGLSGLEVLEGLRQDPATTAIPVLVMSVDYSYTLQEQCTRAGVAGFLRKPFTAEELVASVKQVLPSCEE